VRHVSGVKRVHHPQVGEMELRYEGLDVVSDAGLTIYAYTADPATRSAEALALLGTLAASATAVEHATPSVGGLQPRPAGGQELADSLRTSIAPRA
jgi:hypothetical protein